LYDVIVIGAGPAGSEAAFRLARLGYEVLMVEKEVGMREKACAGGIERIVLNEFGWPSDSIIEREISNLLFVSRGLYRANFSIENSLITVMRSKYDSWLQRRAMEQGAKLTEKTKVKKVMVKGNPTITVNSGRTLTARLLIDASGAHSILRRSQGVFWSREDIAVSVQYHIELSSQEIDERIGNCCEMYFDSTTAPEGYYWIFPKREVVAVGVCGSVSLLQRDRINLKANLDVFIQKYPFASQKLSDGSIRLRQSAILPFRLCHKLVYKNALLIGDAAGLINPLSKGGIYAAQKSASIASKYANAFLETGRQEQLVGYEAEIKAQFHQPYEANRLLVKMLSDDALMDLLTQKTTQTGKTSFNTFLNTLKMFAALSTIEPDSETS